MHIKLGYHWTFGGPLERYIVGDFFRCNDNTTTVDTHMPWSSLQFLRQPEYFPVSIILHHPFPAFLFIVPWQLTGHVSDLIFR